MGKYFTIKELCRSDVAEAEGIDNTPTKEAEENLENLIKHVLDPLREAYGRPIYVNSGYRCESLNSAVKGVKTSNHLNGCAADITVGSKEDNRKLFELFLKTIPDFDELIEEEGGIWLHVAYRKDNNRKKVLYLQ